MSRKQWETNIERVDDILACRQTGTRSYNAGANISSCFKHFLFYPHPLPSSLPSIFPPPPPSHLSLWSSEKPKQAEHLLFSEICRGWADIFFNVASTEEYQRKYKVNVLFLTNNICANMNILVGCFSLLY